jgi:hypothetical protein
MTSSEIAHVWNLLAKAERALCNVGVAVQVDGPKASSVSSWLDDAEANLGQLRQALASRKEAA